MSFKAEGNTFVASVPKELEVDLKEVIDLAQKDPSNPLHYSLVFVQKQEELDAWIDTICPLMEGDAQVWFAYPKKSSKNYKSEITRDSGWAKIGDYRMEPVKQVAVNEDWSALRFRKLDYIKKLTRRDSMRLSK